MSVNDLPDFPWDTIADAAARARSHPDGLIDLSVGSPVDETPAVIREALKAATDAHAYPVTVGTADLREAIAAWFARRRGVTGLAAANAIPTVGSKELVALLPLLLGLGEGDAVVYPEIAYPSYEVGAKLVGAETIPADDPAAWPANTKLVWINSPGNPDGRVLSAAELRAVVQRARELGAVVASDECYAELGWEEGLAVPSLLDPTVTEGDLTGLLAAYSLSKQSNLAGYRAAFIAGDPALISRIATARKHLGLMVPQPVQRAMLTALEDDAHVAVQKERYRARRETLASALRDSGFTIDRSEAGLYLWVTDGTDAWSLLDRLADNGILVAPGTFYGDRGAQHVRVALTASDADIAKAAERLRALVH